MFLSGRMNGAGKKNQLMIDSSHQRAERGGEERTRAAASHEKNIQMSGRPMSGWWRMLKMKGSDNQKVSMEVKWPPPGGVATLVFWVGGGGGVFHSKRQESSVLFFWARQFKY